MEVRSGFTPPPPPAFDPVALAGWLGAPVAMLITPIALTHYADNQSYSIGHAPQIPVAVIIEHRFDSADPADVRPAVMANARTRWRQARGEDIATTAQQHVAEAVREYIASSSARSGISLRPSARPPELDEHLRRPLEGWSLLDVTVDGASLRWQFVTVHDFVSEEEITAIGGSVGATLIAVVGPAYLLGTVALRLHRPRQGGEGDGGER